MHRSLCFLLAVCSMASSLAHAHLLNMTKVSVEVRANGDLSVQMQVDLSRAAGGPLEYYRLSRIEAPEGNPEIVRLMTRLSAAIELRADGAAVPLRLESMALPKLPEQDFVNPLSWPMTNVVLTGAGGAALRDANGMQGVLRPTFPFEEPISLTFSVDDGQRTMTRWLVAGQTSPTFQLHDGAVAQSAEEAAPLWQYVVFGFTHILPKGLDHVLFVIGLYLGARTFRSLLILVTSFTLAHSITLALASVGAVRVPGSIVEPLIAASIVWVGIENFFIARAGNVSLTERWRPLVVFCFGLLHGLGFASVLSELSLPSERFLQALVSFNVGIELGQLAVIALAFAATMWFRRKAWYRARVATPASVAIAAVAAVWALSGCAVRPAEAPVTLKLIALNDFHGQLRPPGGGTRVADTAVPQGGASLSLPTGGVAWLATLVDQLRARSSLNAVVAAGDLIGASPLESGLFHDEPAIEALNAVGLEFSSVGNHEFDEGTAELRRMQNGGCHAGPPQESCRRGRFEGARFRYLAANVLDAATGAPVFPASGIKTFDLGSGRRLKVGFIGAVVKGTPNLVVASGVRDLKFGDEASAVNAAVPGLRKQGAQVIVLLIHEGGYSTSSAFDDDTCPGFSGDIVPIVDRLDPAISVVVSGHTHRAYICRRNGRLLTSAGSQGRYVTDIDVSVEPRSGRVVGTSARQVAVVNDLAPNPLPERYPTVAKDDRVDSIVSFYVAASAPLTERVVAAIASDITRDPSPAGESALGDLIADAQLAATSADENGGAQLALMNRAGIRTDLLARRGSVTFGDIHAIHPFGNALVTITLTGAQLHAVLEQQWPSGSVLQISEGFTYEWSSDAPPGSKVDPRSMRLNGAPLELDKRYRVTVNEFLAGGGDGFRTLTEGTDRRRGIQDAEALERYLAAHSPVVAPRIGRIRRR